MRSALPAVLLAALPAPAADPAPLPGCTHATVAAEPGRFKGWPANYGFWAWGDELLVMYEDGALDASDPTRHTISEKHPRHVEQARSTDGGKTWAVERKPVVKPGKPGAPWNGNGGPEPTRLKAPLDFTAADSALLFVMAHHEYGPHYFYATADRGKTWRGPYALPDWGCETVNPRTDYLVLGPERCAAFVSGGKAHANEDGAETFMVETADGGLTWEKVARANRETPARGFKTPNFTIMPSSVALGGKSFLSLARCHDRAATEAKNWLEAWASDDGGRTWAFRSRLDMPGGTTPPAATRFPSGEVVLTYGHRERPFGVRGRVSKDGGKTWGPELVLRADGGNFDLGYTRNVVRRDGKVVTVYYFNTDPKGERTVQATIWDPLAAGR